MSTNITINEKPEYIMFNSFEGKLIAVCMDSRNWKPKKGDYYTAARADLELYMVVNEDEDHFYTVYCTKPEEVQKWRKDEFTDPNGFFFYRRYVPMQIVTDYCTKIVETHYVG